MKALIIGSKGFIGSHLVNHLRKKGHDVTGADVVVDYVDTDRYFTIDASNSDFSMLFRDHEFDVCVNCSGAASVPESLTNPSRDYFLNTVNVFKMLDAINHQQKNCRFINLSSAAVYGNPESLPIREDAKASPLSPYGLHKFQAEQICKEFTDYWKLKTINLRIFSVYGEGLKKQLFWDLNRKARSEKTITLFGTGKESRDFMHVSDLVRAIEIIIESAEFSGEVINVANGEEVFIKDAVSVFFSFYEPAVAYTFSGESRQGDPVNWKADISMLRKFGYEPEIDIKEGLKRYYNWLSEFQNL